jgi:hypothetical protein
MLSCDNCRISKKKCTRGQPCERCEERGDQCTYQAEKYVSEVVPKRDKVEARLKELEELMKDYIMFQYGEEIDMSIPFEPSKGLKRSRSNPYASPTLSDSSWTFSPGIHSDRFISNKIEINDTLPSPQLKLYLDTYLKTSYFSYPFINKKHIKLLYKARPLHTPLLYVMYLSGQLILIRQNKNTEYPCILENDIYKLIKYLMMVQNNDNTLLNIQTLVLLADVEAHNNRPTDASLHLIQATRKLQLLENNYLPVNTSSKLMFEREKAATYTMATKVDSLVCCLNGTPAAIHFTEEHLLKSLENYDSFIFVKILATKPNKRKYMNISDEDLLQHNQYLAMELYTSWVFITYNVNKFKTVLKQFDISQTEILIEKWKALCKNTLRINFARMDAKTFNEKYPINDPYFNIHLTNYVLIQLQTMNGAHLMGELIQNFKEYTYPSPAQSAYSADEACYIYVKERSMNNLTEVLFCQDPERKKYIDNMRNIDFVYLLPHFFIFKDGESKYSELSKEIALREAYKWPCVESMFKMCPPTRAVLNSDKIQPLSPFNEISNILPKPPSPKDTDFRAGAHNVMYTSPISS